MFPNEHTEEKDDLLSGEEVDLPAEDERGEDPSPLAPSLEPEALLSAELGSTALLTRPEEEALGRKIVRARKRVRAILRRMPALTRAALPQGRGVVAPQTDFRERESVMILKYAQEAVCRRRSARVLGVEHKQLRAFAAELSMALDEYRTYRDQMVRANVRLVYVMARRYRHPNLSFLDLFQEGTMGLFRAIEKYDPDRNIRFSTYATWWIWQQLGRSADTHGSLIRLEPPRAGAGSRERWAGRAQ